MLFHYFPAIQIQPVGDAGGDFVGTVADVKQVGRSAAADVI
jgi:hypothetical protein